MIGTSFTIDITEEDFELAGVPMVSEDDLEEVAQMMLEEYQQGLLHRTLKAAVKYLHPEWEIA